MMREASIAQRKPVLGLVGGIGSGKSAVAQMLVDRGGRMVQGDPIGHEALQQPEIIAQVAARFGKEVLDAQGQVVRRRLGERVFADADERKALEAIVFPWIRRRMEERIAAAAADPDARFVVLDAAIMLEAGWNTACDRLVYVHAPRATRLARLADRGWSDEQIDQRERAQWPLARKAQRADAAIDNSGDLAATARQVDVLLTDWGLRSTPA